MLTIAIILIISGDFQIYYHTETNDVINSFQCNTVNEQECNTVNEQVCETVNEQQCRTVQVYVSHCLSL